MIKHLIFGISEFKSGIGRGIGKLKSVFRGKMPNRLSEDNDIFSRLGLFYKLLSKPFVMREEEAKVIILSLLSSEHAVFIGEPGTAKSAIVRRAASLLRARYFYYVLNKYTEPDELFGPVDINVLREKGVYKRRVEGKLPTAEIVFLDEIFKANTAILNTLLSILQERVFANGDEIIETPLISLFSASNEIPDEVELKTLYDRLLFRHYVKPVPENKLKDLLKAGVQIEIEGVLAEKPVLSISELKILQGYVEKALSKIVNSKDFIQQYARLIIIFREHGITVTDRRAVKGLKAIAANMVFEGRLTVKPEDLLVLKYVIPENIDDFDKVAAIISEEVKLPMRYLKDLEILERNILRLRDEALKLTRFDLRLLDYSKKLFVIERKLNEIAREALDDPQVEVKVRKLLNIIGELKDLLASKAGF
ncbi:MAG TPA: MoxR family ATPase [Desulfurococcales archaeon]|nr:MoxR family ATPase [Desulfurococcales archaeon]